MGRVSGVQLRVWFRPFDATNHTPQDFAPRFPRPLPLLRYHPQALTGSDIHSKPAFLSVWNYQHILAVSPGFAPSLLFFRMRHKRSSNSGGRRRRWRGEGSAGVGCGLILVALFKAGRIDTLKRCKIFPALLRLTVARRHTRNSLSNRPKPSTPDDLGPRISVQNHQRK